MRINYKEVKNKLEEIYGNILKKRPELEMKKEEKTEDEGKIDIVELAKTDEIVNDSEIIDLHEIVEENYEKPSKKIKLKKKDTNIEEIKYLNPEAKSEIKKGPPSISASKFDVGYEMISEKCGLLYVVKQLSNGTKRWAVKN
jgi:hypothetical protein